MRLKDLYIRNFGLFSNQVLEDLHPGLVIIGGYNRAGKTTFMQILRHLGYGFSQSSDFFQLSKHRFDVESTVLLEEGEVCNLQLTGFAEPLVSYQKDFQKTISLREIYNHLDILTYQQIFSISLDELQQLPKGISPKNADKIQSILLGAGLADMVQIPHIEEYMRKEAEKIGGKNGSPRVREFKPYNLQIKDGLALREAAWQQIDQYQDKKSHLAQLTDQLNSNEEEIGELNAQITRLDVLKNNYLDCREIERLEMIIDNLMINTENQEKYVDLPSGFLEKAKDLRVSLITAEENYHQHLRQLKERRKTDDLIKFKNDLLSLSTAIDKSHHNLSGLREKLRNYYDLKDNHLKQHEEIVAQMNSLNIKWGGDFEKILTINTDQIQQDLLVQQIDKFRDLQRRETINQERLKELEKEKARLKHRWESIKFSNINNHLKIYYLWASLFILAGIIVSLFNLWLGGICGLTGIIGTLIILIYKYFTESALRLDKTKIERQLEIIQLQINDKQQDLQRINASLDLIDADLNCYRQKLGLSPSASLEMIQHFYQRIPQIRRDINKLHQLEAKKTKVRLLLTMELTKIASLVDQFSHGKVGRENDLIDKNAEIFYAVEYLVEDLKIAKELENSEQIILDLSIIIRELIQCDESDTLLLSLNEFITNGEEYVRLEELKTQIEALKIKILQALKTDRVRKAFNLSSSDDQGFIQSFQRFFALFTSAEDVQQVYDDAKRRLVALEELVNQVKEQRQSTRDEIARLATTDNLKQAQSQIDDARSYLRPLAEKYAIYSGAAFLLKQIKKRFIESTKGTLLSEASVALQQITGGEYQQILPPDDLMIADFQTLATSGVLKKTVEVLSRGTREQLFLAVRLSRIKEITPPLPVILDDSLVNFDLPHRQRALDLFIELANTHQVFVLTCQPYLPQYIIESGARAQYWRLEEGRFRQTEGVDLVNYLSAVPGYEHLA